ncbi:MAG: leucine-rich repeat domain-containing protein [Candidatus Paceibacterota bacterium]
MGLISLLLAIVIIVFGFMYISNETETTAGKKVLEERLNTEKTVNNMVNQAVPDSLLDKSSEANDDQVIDLSYQNLTKEPSGIFSRKEVTVLDLSHNKLSGSLPAEIRHLQNLQTLDLSDNNFTGVPAEIGQLSKLEVLDLSNNPITGLPYELSNLSNLKVLNLIGTNYSKQDLDFITKNLSENVKIITK